MSPQLLAGVTSMRRLPPPIRWPGAAAESIAWGRHLLARNFDAVPVALPGAFVWGGRDHALVAGSWWPTVRAWGRGEEPLRPLSEVARWAPMPAGIDDTRTGW